jgi:hypothetical protein
MRFAKASSLNRMLIFCNSSVKVAGGVTSIAFDDQDHFYAGTASSNIYLVNANDLTHKLKTSCHYSSINDICFPG